MAKRAFVIVLDSFGLGELPDADKFGDKGANTLASIVKSAEYNTPLMREMGLFNIDGVKCKSGVEHPTGCYARMTEKSMGKDTTIGHWEMAGVISPDPLPTYPDGFPADIMEQFEKLTGRKTLCNKPYSGTEVIKDYGEEHMKTGALIIYTSADSVFQIAANEAVVPLEELYEDCRKARKLLTDSKTHAVGRVIARPFIGTDKSNFTRTSNRHDFSLEPPHKTMLDFVADAGLDTIGVGKIYDIFAGQGVKEKILIKGNHNGMDVTIALADRDFEGLAFVNLVDFDMLYGHRNNVDGYAAAATEFDLQLHDFVARMREDDLLIITSDHGCDPGFIQSTDHSREYALMLAYGKCVKPGVNLGTLPTFADLGSTVCDFLGADASIAGTSFWSKIKK